MKQIVIGVVVLTLTGLGAWYAFGGGDEQDNNTYGKGTDGTLISIGEIQNNPAKYLGQTVTVEGEMTKECPSSGCWWYVKDETGEIRADSFGAGFALPLHQEKKRIRTTGVVVKAESGELQIASTGAEIL